MAKTLQDKINALEEYMAAIPRHKGTERLLQQLRTKHSKLRALLELEQRRKARSIAGAKYALKKEGAAQVVILAPTGAGKSTLLSALTNSRPEISGRPFTTTEPTLGMMRFEDVEIQLIEAPALYEGAYERAEWGAGVLGLARNCDGIVIMLDLSGDASTQMEMLLNELRKAHIEVMDGGGKAEIQEKKDGGIQVVTFSGFCGDVEEIRQTLRARGIQHALVKVWGRINSDDVASFLGRPMVQKPTLVIANKVDIKGAEDRLEELRRRFPSLPIVAVSLLRKQNLENLSKQIFQSLKIMRIYTKKVGQKPSSKPIVVKAGSTVLDVAKSIHSDLYKNFKFAKVWGSSRYLGERVGGGYVLNDRDIVEIHT
jgi:ribosome-interacting GTPase 1